MTDQANLIDAYDRARDARFSIPEQSQREIDRFGVAEFYGWSEEDMLHGAGLVDFTARPHVVLAADHALGTVDHVL